ncbi:SDR family oxidoreductase [Kitasatospora sp. NPDC094016]|uniref:SDR family NAD(P)-dependent oxidoreductase n=1 Tax=Kitasatospora sp. NPDC094016 TaxID=3154986 RepID=UPI00332E6BCF
MGVFDDRICVVTGASSGIGLATARLLAGEGATVVLAQRSDGGALAAELGGMYVPTDVSDAVSIEGLYLRVGKEFGRVDVLVNNAGIMAEVELDDLDGAEFHRVLEVNSTSVMLGMKHAARLMPAGSAIVNNASIAARLGLTGYAPYAASKAAVVSLTQVAAMEYGHRGIRVNCVCPSSVETPMLQKSAGGDLERAVSRLASPLGITITAGQVADVIAFLASPSAAALTGQALNVDAGMSAGYANPLLETVAATL